MLRVLLLAVPLQVLLIAVLSWARGPRLRCRKQAKNLETHSAMAHGSAPSSPSDGRPTVLVARLLLAVPLQVLLPASVQTRKKTLPL